MSENFLVVFNTCEISCTNLFWYVDCLTNLLRQDHPTFQIVVSGCKLSASTKHGLRTHFGKNLWYNFIDEVYPVNVTFNHTLKTIVKNKGEFDGYIYVDSGMNTTTQTNVFSEIAKRSATKKYGMITIQSGNDRGYYLPGLGVKHDHLFTPNDPDIEVPVGGGCNLHFQYFDKRVFAQYQGLMPDIFKTFSTESVFTFMNAALGLKWIILSNLVVFHNKSTDGPSSGYKEEHYGKKQPWNNLIGGLDVVEHLMTDEAKALGMGYEECGDVFMHDPAQYTPEGFSKHPRFKDFLKEKLFVPPSIVDYDKIVNELYIE